jgi:hypothetical protein
MVTIVAFQYRLKPVFHFNRNVTYRSIFFCVEVISSILVVRKQRNTLRFATIEVENRTNDFDTKENATVRYDCEVENRL